MVDKRNVSYIGNAKILIFLGWLVYAMSYLGKVNYSANITQIIDFYGVTKAQAGTVPTFFFFAYGTGQVFNGFFCKKYNIKWMIFSSLIISGCINLIVAVSKYFVVIKWLWMINGFVLSVLWPTLIRLLSEAMPKKYLVTSSAVMGTTVAVGTLLVYATSSIYVFFNKFKLSFYTAGIVAIFVAVIWMLLYNKALDFSKKEKEREEVDIQPDTSVSENQKNSEKKIIFTTIYVLCFYAIGVNLIKDGLTTWVPSILKDEFSMSDTLSIFLTLFLPVLAVFGNAYAIRVHKKIKDYVSQCAMVFGVIVVLISIIICSLFYELTVVMIIGLVAVNFLASSLNSLITGVFPLFMRGKINSGLFAGILNGFCYSGSTISAYVLGAIADNFGWISVFWSLLFFCLLTLVVWIGYIFLKICYERKNVNNSCDATPMM